MPFHWELQILSMQNIFDFWKKTKTDAGLRQQLSLINEKEPVAIVAAVVKLATEAGFEFTAEQYNAAVEEELARQHASGELNDAHLQWIAGGNNVRPNSGHKGCNS